MTIVVLSVMGVSSAQVRTSTNFQLQSDSINVGGGFSSSASYNQESTVGEIATGQSDSSTYSLRAGYQQMQEVFISLATSGNVNLTPDLPGLTGGESNGSTTFTVTTDSPSGYQLTIKAENNPAMQSGVSTIADYDAGAVTDFSFTTGATDAHLGFTPEGVDIVQAFKDDGGSTCNVDTSDTTLACWDGLSTTARTIALGVGSNHPNGATTTVHFRVGIGGNAGVQSGMYTATSTVTALSL
ncbi:MAG: hypothetical protein H6782_03170 [Candidatus Nomurabacteria bacterium]|nr:MAG: hypothetical protein H6782_03170 [Candidatus Nomurabacteria bacterium]